MILKIIKPLAVIDVETTGLNPQEDRIIDICITKIFPEGNEETFNSLINPLINIPIESTEIHKITDKDVEGKPTFKEFSQEILDFINNCDLCGFRINFDLSILESEFKRCGVHYSKEGRIILDIQHIYYKLEPRDLNAAHLKYCGTSLENAHRAYSDVRATINILNAQLEQNKILPRDISSLQEFCNPKDPSWIDDDGKLSWFRGKAIINFGKKHKWKTLEDVYKNDPGYLQWIINEDFSSQVKDIIKEALKGKFPESE